MLFGNLAAEFNPYLMGSTNLRLSLVGSIYLHKNNNNFDVENFCGIKFLLTNARSLSPKIISLIDCMDMVGASITVVTESWLADGENLEVDLRELEFGTDLCVIYKNRPVRPSSRRRTSGGGVAIIYNKTVCSLRERKIARNKYELVCAKGRINDMERNIVVVGVYIEPKMTAARLADLLLLLEDLVLQEKAAATNPYFIVAGDVNRRDLGPAFDNYEDFGELDHGPTRGDEKLDRIWTNLLDNADTRVLPPLETELGTKSDHNCVATQLIARRVRKFVWQKIRMRKKSREGNEKFGGLVENEDWEALFQGLTPTQMVDILHKKFEDWMNICFLTKYAGADPTKTRGSLLLSGRK